MSKAANQAPFLRNGIQIDATFAEAFGMKATRVIVTAHNRRWAMNAAQAAIGFATSVIACGAEAGIEAELAAKDTPDGRPGVSLLFFALSGKELTKQIERRIGQCVLTCPTTAAFAGIHEGESIALGKNLRYFGDGFQISKLIGDRRYWRIPVMDGEFLVQESTAVTQSVGGGNFLLLADSIDAALASAEAAVSAIRRLPNVILPFPGGVVRSGSKVGSKYAAMKASTNDAFCPTLRGATASALGPQTRAVLEIVIDGLTHEDVAQAMRVGLQTVCERGRTSGVHRISAGNYGGKLGAFHYHLQELLA